MKEVLLYLAHSNLSCS